jgi:hypothetical protein
MRCGLQKQLVQIMLVNSKLSGGAVLMVVGVAAMLLTIPFDSGFGKESLAGKFLLMIPRKEAEIVMGFGRSIGPLTNLVKTIIGLDDNLRNGKEEQKSDEMMID